MGACMLPTLPQMVAAQAYRQASRTPGTGTMCRLAAYPQKDACVLCASSLFMRWQLAFPFLVLVVQRLPVSVSELVNQSPVSTMDGNMLMGSQHTSVFVLDGRTGQLIR